MLGANDGIVSTASLIVRVAAASATQHDVLVAGVAGLVAGAMSMAAGEYVSVSSQSDTEQAELARECRELSENVEFELDELAEIYVKRGVAWRQPLLLCKLMNSPHFQMAPKVSAKAGISASISANRSINGCNRTSGIVGINS